MKPTRYLMNSLAALMANDVTCLGAATAMKVGLIIEPFTPSADLTIGSVVISAAAGLAPIAGVAGAQLESIDPLTGENVAEVKAPAGGFRWEVPGPTTPTTVYGYALTNNLGDSLLATEAINPPLVFTGDANQSHTAPALKFRIDGLKIF
jgi:hypothetical protein